MLKSHLLEIIPVSGTSIESIDIERVRDYLGNVIRDPEMPANSDEWQRRLCGMGFMTDAKIDRPVCTIA